MSRRLLIDKLGTPLAKFMAKIWLGEPAAIIAGGLLDIVSSRYSEHEQQEKAESRFQDLGVDVSSRLLPLFEGESARRSERGGSRLRVAAHVGGTALVGIDGTGRA